MRTIRIENPGDIRKEVNKLKQHDEQEQQQQCYLSTSGDDDNDNDVSPSSLSSSPTFRSYFKNNNYYYKKNTNKRRTVSYHLQIDFTGCGQSLSHKIITVEDLATLIAYCGGHGRGHHGRLEYLSLEDVLVVGSNFDAVLLEAIRKYGQFLRTFTSYTCRIRNEPNDMIHLGETLADACPNLESIAFGFSHDRYQPALAIVTPIVARRNSKLTKIFVNGFHLFTSRENITVQQLQLQLQRQEEADDEEEDEEEEEAAVLAQMLQRIHESDEQVTAFFNALQTYHHHCSNSKLQRVLLLPMLTGAFTPVHMQQHITRFIQQNIPALEVLQLHMQHQSHHHHLHFNNSCSQRTTCMVELAHALRYNTHLKKLSIDELHVLDIKSVLEQATAFHECLREYNFTITDLSCCHEQWTMAGRRSLAVQQELDGIKFHLSLNRMGRAQLLLPKVVRNNNNCNSGIAADDQHPHPHPHDTTSVTATQGNVILATTDEWMEAIANKDDPSFIFYFLEKNPSLCSPLSYKHEGFTTRTAISSAKTNSGDVAVSSNSFGTIDSRSRFPAGNTNMVSPLSLNDDSDDDDDDVISETVRETVRSALFPAKQKPSNNNRNNNNKKRSREEAFGWNNDTIRKINDSAVEKGWTSTSTTSVTRDVRGCVATGENAQYRVSPLRAFQNAASYAAVFAAGYFARGLVDQA